MRIMIKLDIYFFFIHCFTPAIGEQLLRVVDLQIGIFSQSPINGQCHGLLDFSCMLDNN